MVALILIGTVGALLAVQPPPAPPSGPHPPAILMQPGQVGSRMQVNFPPASHSQVSRGTYWLGPSEPLSIDVQLSIDPQRGSAAIPVEGTVMIDAVQIPVAVGRARAGSFFRRLVTPGKIDRFTIAVRGARISAGVHACALMFWEPDRRPFPGWGFTIVKGSATPRWSDGSQSFVVSPSNERDAISLRLLRPRNILMFGPPLDIKPDADGSVSLFAHLAITPRQDHQLHTAYTLVALLDGRQVPFKGGVSSPTVTIDPGQSGDATLDLRDLPSAGAGHRLLFFLLARESPTAEGVAEAPWMVLPPRQLGGLAW